MTSLQYILQTTVFKKEKEVLEICCVFPSVTFKTKCTQAAKSGSGTRRWKQHRRQNQQKKSNFLVAASTWRVIKRCQSYYLGVRRSIGVFLFPCRFLPIQILKETSEMGGGWNDREMLWFQPPRPTYHVNQSRTGEDGPVLSQAKLFSPSAQKKKPPRTARVQPNGVNRERRCDIIVPTFCTAIVTVD